MKFRLFFIIIIKLLLFLGLLFDSTYAKTRKTKSNTTRITSDYIDIKRKSQKIEFIDNVVVRNGPDMMTSKKMIVYYKSEEKNDKKGKKNKKKKQKSKKNKSTSENSSIEKIISEGDVKLFSTDFVATSDSGYYNPNKSVFILEKNVVVNNGGSIGTGDKFIYNLNNRKGKFVGNKKNIDGDSRVIIVIDKDAERPSKNSKKK